MRDRKDDHTHRRVAETKLGRKLLPNEVADHVNEDKSDNSPANIRVATRGKHTTQHNKNRALSKLREALRMPKEGKKIY